ncbi:MAG: hypothetical protein AB1656_24675 [Candidatus Omnitrophota bacterium]
METLTYCRKCVLHSSHPGIALDENGECDICRGENRNHWIENYEEIASNYEKFQSYKPANGDYESVLMLSGGKDSIYMLWKLIHEEQRKILVYTYNHPFESDNAIQNVQKVLDKMDVQHLYFTAHAKYKALMRSVFAKENRSHQYQSEMTPCKVCSSYMTLTGCLMALRMNIPFVLYCADPIQIIVSESFSSIKRLIKLLMEYVDIDMLNYVFDCEIASLLEKQDEELPTVVFPYISIINDYDKDKIVSVIKAKGLYDSSSIQTSCSLYPLLEYYAYKNFRCSTASVEIAAAVRQGYLPREAALNNLKEYKKIFYDMLSKPDLSEEDKLYIRDFAERQIPESKEDADYVYEKIIAIKETARKIGVEL